MKCPTNITVIKNDDPICEEFTSTTCITHPTAIASLSLPANSTQQLINNSLAASQVNISNRVTTLENNSFTDAQLTINGDYTIQSTDNKKYIYITQAINTPTIFINPTLPDGFECYFFYTPANTSGTAVAIDYSYATPPIFTVPFINGQACNILQPYCSTHIKKRAANFFTATGELTPNDI